MSATDSTAGVLWRPHSIVDNFPFRGRRFDGVKLAWLVTSRPEPLGRYDELLKPYEPALPWEHATDTALLDELFTTRELDALAAYLAMRHGERVYAETVSTPIPTVDPDGFTYISTGAFPAGGLIDFFGLHREDGYDLPFAVDGCYDMHDPIERLDGDPWAVEYGADYAVRDDGRIVDVRHDTLAKALGGK